MPREKKVTISDDHRRYIDGAKYMWTSLERCVIDLAGIIHHKANGKVTERQAQLLAGVAEQEMKADGTWIERDDKGYKVEKS